MNRKEKRRRGKIEIVDATSFFKKMRKSLGNKRNEICEPQRDEITRLYGEFKEAALAEPLVESVRLVESMCARVPVRGAVCPAL